MEFINPQWDYHEHIKYNGYSLSFKGILSEESPEKINHNINKIIFKIEHESHIQTILDLLFGYNGKKKQLVVTLNNIFGARTIKKKRIDSIIDGLMYNRKKIPKEVLKALFLYDPKRISLQKELDANILLKYCFPEYF